MYKINYRRVQTPTAYNYESTGQSDGTEQV